MSLLAGGDNRHLWELDFRQNHHGALGAELDLLLGDFPLMERFWSSQAKLVETNASTEGQRSVLFF